MKTNVFLNKYLFKILVVVLAIFTAVSFLLTQEKKQTFAMQVVQETNYVVYTDDEEFLFERISVEVGDIYISKNFEQYQVYLVDQTTRKAKARFVKQLKRPNITKKSHESLDTTLNKKIALYLTHNAESYLLGDGTDSYYGMGGIHDVANKFADELRKKGVSAEISQTLHLPHDSLAYSRSKVTAQKLLEGNPDAIFDIHRDGVSRGVYAKVKNGQEHSTVRIVVGQANPNQGKNLAFATWLLSVAEVTHPWLFLDIYFAKGHYNQNLSEKALLFEMGTYTIEKNLVMDTVEPLASVICTTLYSTFVDEDGDLTIGEKDNEDSQTVNQVLNSKIQKTSSKSYYLATVIILSVASCFIFIYKWRKKTKPLNK